jgi:hypothetical protein
MENIDLTHLSDADLLELETLLEAAEKRGGFSKRTNTNFPNNVTYDVKYAYHLVRLLNEVEQILVEGDLDLQRNREQLKDIRRGEWTLDQIERYFEEKERLLEATYTASKLPHSPDENAIKRLLMNCLEEHYGDLTNAVRMDANVEALVQDMRAVLDRYSVS